MRVHALFLPVYTTWSTGAVPSRAVEGISAGAQSIAHLDQVLDLVNLMGSL